MKPGAFELWVKWIQLVQPPTAPAAEDGFNVFVPPTPDAAIARTLPSRPHIASQSPAPAPAPCPDNRTAQQPMSGHGDVTLRTGVIIRTSVSTTTPSVDIDAKMSPPEM